MTTPEPQQSNFPAVPASGSLPAKGGAPKKNRNNMRHGLRGSQLPKGCSYILKSLNEFRRSLEAVVMESKGEVTLLDAASINSAFRWEKHAQLAQRWLHVDGAKMSHSDRLNYSREAARASDSRDRAIAALGLGKSEQDDFFAKLDALPPVALLAPPESPATSHGEGKAGPA